MANISYLSLSGETQGLISAGCSTLDSVGNKAQPEHKDQIMVYALMHSISRSQNVNHHELIITTPVDKSSPLLAKALTEGIFSAPLHSLLKVAAKIMKISENQQDKKKIFSFPEIFANRNRLSSLPFHPYLVASTATSIYR